MTIDEAYPLWLLALSLATFFAYGWDKLCAMRKRPRIPERTLLLLILAGGWLGGWMGQVLFRHKTRTARFWLAILLAAGLHGILVWLRFRGAGI